MENLGAKLQVFEDMDNGKLTSYELLAIASIFESNTNTLFSLNAPTILTASGTNIKVTVTYTQNGSKTTINLQYTRLTNSFASGDTGATVIDCHYYKYTETPQAPSTFNITEAKSQLRSQINTDKFLNTLNGDNQRKLLIFLVDKVVTGKDYDNIRFRFQKDKVVIYDSFDKSGKEIPRILFETDINAGGESDGVIYIDTDTATKIVEIVYPLICLRT